MYNLFFYKFDTYHTKHIEEPLVDLCKKTIDWNEIK